MAKDKKAKAAAKKERVAAKVTKKTAQKEKKAKTKPSKSADSDGDDDTDLDAILAQYAKQQEQFLAVTETKCAAPPPRSAGTLIAHPTDAREVFLFGGEHFNGALATFSNELFVYRIRDDEWRRVTSPNSPLPRSGHAMCAQPNTGDLYLFGGEFSSPKQGTFYHYSDFWRLDPASREWEKIETKGPAPSARSGHRMVGFKRYVIIFGGFQDTSAQTKYLNDVWIYDCMTFTWHTPVLPPAAGRPDARSSFSFLPHETGAVLYGGYSRVKASTTAGAKTKGGRQGSRVVMKPIVHQDTWFLRITAPGPDATHNTLPTVRWERRKRPANTPTPARAGATMVHHKGRGIAFGGVHDVEESEEGIESEFFNQLWAYNIDRNRFFQLALRKARPVKKATGGAGAEKSRRGRGRADEEELLRNLALIEKSGTLDADQDIKIDMGDNSDDEEEKTKIQKPVVYEMPHPRFNAQLAVQDDVLYVYSGTFEKGDREFTFDELHAIDLGKLDGAKEIFRRELEDWQGSEDEDSDDDGSGSSGSDDDDDGEASDNDDDTSPSTPATSIADPESVKTDKKPADDEIEADPEPAKEEEDPLPHPRPFESLRAFFARSSNEWQETILEELKYKHGSEAERSVKEIRKGAFERAEQKWWDCREEIQKLEDEAEEAGIGEVVSLADKGGATGPKRR